MKINNNKITNFYYFSLLSLVYSLGYVIFMIYWKLGKLRSEKKKSFFDQKFEKKKLHNELTKNIASKFSSNWSNQLYTVSIRDSGHKMPFWKNHRRHEILNLIFFPKLTSHIYRFIKLRTLRYWACVVPYFICDKRGLLHESNIILTMYVRTQEKLDLWQL